MYLPTTIKVAILKSSPNSEGLFPIVIRFTQNRRSHIIYLRKYIPLEEWINEGNTFIRERGSTALANAKELNLFLISQITRAHSILLNAERINTPISFKQFKEKFVNMDNQDFIAFCEKELDRRETSGKYSPATIKSNWFKLNKLKTFRTNLSFFDLTPKTLEEYENYLRVNRNNDVNTIFAAMKFIRTMLNSARKQNLTKVYPFDQYKLVYKKNTRDRLNMEELELLQKVYNEETLPEHLQNVLTYFLFACYTGLTWGDLVSLDYKEIEKEEDTYLINKKRQKTENQFIVPLIDKARILIDLTKKEGKVFPYILTNQKANAAIKDVIARTKVKRKISFHCARHSFASVALNMGIPREVIQKMLGHSKEEMTKLYSKLQNSTIISEMKKWNNDVPASDYEKRLSEETIQIYKNLRTQIIANRIAGGHSELNVAEKIGVSEANYKKMEKGELQFGMAHLLETCKFLNLNTKVLFTQFL